VNCPANSCNYSGRCFANGTIYNNFRCSNGNIVRINSTPNVSASTPTVNNSNVNNSAASCASSVMSFDEFKRFQNAGLVSDRAQINVGSTNASLTIFNNTSCNMPVSFVSWKMYDRSAANQVRFDSKNSVVSAHSSKTLTVSLPNCMAQIDAYYGSAPSSPLNDKEFLLAWDFSQNNGGGLSDASGNFCRNTPPAPNPEPEPEPTCTNCNPTPADLTGSCSVSPATINIGGRITWSVSVSGGDGDYDYSWRGTNNLTGNSSSFSKIYYSAGIKSGTVTITSDGESITRTCSAVVLPENIPVDDDLDVTCSVNQSTADVDEEVTWRAYATGGDGSYDYDWSGTDGLDGSSRNIDWSYDDSGTKRATITVESDGQTASASCTVRVNVEEDDNDDLSVSCYGSPSTSQVGSRIRWYVEVDGGDGDYDYDWSGTNGLNSSSKSPYMTYSTVGRKTATVTVRDGDGQRDSDTCYVNINSVLAFSQINQTPLADAVYLNQIPYTGVADNMKLYFFVGVLALFSAWISYIVISYKKEKGELN
jgi:hypothetical protein